MKINRDACLLKKMISLIISEKTGSPAEFSKELGISRSQLYIEIDELNSYDLGIRFSRKCNSFVISGNKRIIVREPILILDNECLSEICGGFCKKIIPFFFLDGATLS